MSGGKKRLIIPAVCALAVLLGAAVFAFFRWGGSDPKKAGMSYPAHFITPEGEYTLASESGGLLTLPDGGLIEGYVFLGWKNEAGETLRAAETVRLTEEAYFSAVYTVDLIRTSHPAYLFPDGEARCRPYLTMTRADAARMFYELLAVKVEGEESFTDVAFGSELWEATAALRLLGLAEGEAYRPDDPLTRGELLDMLSHFFPAAQTTAAFADLEPGSAYAAAFSLAAERGWIESGAESLAAPQRVLTRLETARIMNRVLERGERPGELVERGDVLRDLPPEGEDRQTMLEAVISHQYGGAAGRLRWTNAEYPVALIPGFSSGDIELDTLLKAVLDEQLGEETDPIEQLRLLYRFVRDKFQYHKGELYEPGDVSWLSKEAKQLLQTGKGNCYAYAGLLCELYRAVGVDAEPYSGSIVGRPHAWVEAEIDGVRYIFDVEMEYSFIHQQNPVDMFMRTYEEMEKWSYRRD